MRQRFEQVMGGAIEVERRDDRWIALGHELVGMICDDPRRQEAEAWLIQRYRAERVPAPRFVWEREGVQVRERLRGLTGEEVHREPDRSPMYAGTFDVRARLVSAPLTAFGENVADSYGEVCARIRRAVDPAELDAQRFGETEIRRFDLDAALAAFAASAASERAKRIAARRRGWLADVPACDAVIHSDLHFHNLCADGSGRITGIWDFGGVGHDAAATELHYAPSLGRQFVDRVVAAYGEVDREAVDRAHLRTALDHVLYHHPGKPRHDGVVEWTTAVLEHLG